GIRQDDFAWTLNDRVPLFIRVPAVERAADAFAGAHTSAHLAGAHPQPAGQTDVAPTLLSLFGIDASAPPHVGRNLLAGAGEDPVPRPYGEWLDARHLFVPHGAAPVCYDLEARRIAERHDCVAGDARARRERDVSRLVVADDLQERLREQVQ